MEIIKIVGGGKWGYYIDTVNFYTYKIIPKLLLETDYILIVNTNHGSYGEYDKVTTEFFTVDEGKSLASVGHKTIKTILAKKLLDYYRKHKSLPNSRYLKSSKNIEGSKEVIKVEYTPVSNQKFNITLTSDKSEKLMKIADAKSENIALAINKLPKFNWGYVIDSKTFYTEKLTHYSPLKPWVVYVLKQKGIYVSEADVTPITTKYYYSHSSDSVTKINKNEAKKILTQQLIRFRNKHAKDPSLTPGQLTYTETAKARKYIYKPQKYDKFLLTLPKSGSKSRSQKGSLNSNLGGTQNILKFLNNPK